MLNFLIDECCSPKLAVKAKERGHNAFHVTWLQLEGHRDHALATYAMGCDAIIVTNNGSDFRPIYKSLDVHPGLVVILPSSRQEIQVALFDKLLTHIAHERDLINKLVQISLDGTITVDEFPPFQNNI